jgi:hypothetical protein
MEIKLDPEKLKNTKVFVATPMYGGMCCGSYTRSMIDLTITLQQYGVPMSVYYMFNESLIQRARNYCADEFLRSDCTHLLFIDADIDFKPIDVVAMLALSQDNDQYHILGAPYPKKTISWEKVKIAVDKGFADEDPNTLSEYVGDFVFNLAHGGPMRIDIPQEVLELGTGFMLIKRETFTLFKDKYKDTYQYTPDHARSKNFSGGRQIDAYFHCEIDEKTNRYLSEDYFFTQRVREAGGKTWLCPWIKLNHTGTYIFGGSLEAIARIGVSATIDPQHIKK